MEDADMKERIEATLRDFAEVGFYPMSVRLVVSYDEDKASKMHRIVEHFIMPYNIALSHEADDILDLAADWLMERHPRKGDHRLMADVFGYQSFSLEGSEALDIGSMTDAEKIEAMNAVMRLG